VKYASPNPHSPTTPNTDMLVTTLRRAAAALEPRHGLLFVKENAANDVGFIMVGWWHLI
jgi:hypothetical protein